MLSWLEQRHSEASIEPYSPGGPHSTCPSAEHMLSKRPYKILSLGKAGDNLLLTVLPRQRAAKEKVQSLEALLG